MKIRPLYPQTTTALLTNVTMLLASSLLASSLAAQEGADAIHLVAEKPLLGVEVTEAGFGTVKYKKGGAEKEVDSSKVVEIVWGQAPESLAKARAAERRGVFEEAGNLYLAAAKEAKRPALQLAAQFHAGRVYLRGAGDNALKRDAGISAIEKYLTDAPKGLYSAQAGLILARAKISAGDGAGADTRLQTMIAGADAAGWPAAWGAQIQFERGRALALLGQFEEARRAFDAAINSVDLALADDSRFTRVVKQVRSEAQILKGDTFINEKKLNLARGYFESLTKAPGSTAAGLAGIGEVLLLEGAPSKDARLLRQAQITLAQATVDFEGSEATLAKSLFLSGKVLLALGDAELDAAKRARAYFAAVQSTFPHSTWAQQARQELSGGK